MTGRRWASWVVALGALLPAHAVFFVASAARAEDAQDARVSTARGSDAGAPDGARELAPADGATPTPISTGDAGTAPSPRASPSDAGPAPSEDGCPAERFVFVAPAPDLDPELLAEVRTDLATELGHRGLPVCDPGSTTREPAVIVELSRQDALVVIELDDRVTHKRVARDLSVASMPANGRALAIAVAIDELLRASWAELSLNRATKSEPEAPTAAAEPPPPPKLAPPRRRERRASTLHLAGALGYLNTPHGFDAFSLDARGALRVLEHGWLEIGVGGLASLPSSGAYGDALASGVRTSLTIGACTEGRRRAFTCGGARTGLDWISFRGIHATDATTRRQHALLAHTSFVGLLAVMLTEDVYLFGELALGALTKGARATDGTRTLMGVTGLLLSVHLGIGVEL